MAATVLETQRLSRSYGERIGIDGVDLAIDEGCLFGFLGPNGAGKTTTIRVLLGFLQPTGGQASIFGKDCWRESASIKREVGFLPSDLRLYPWMNAMVALRVASRVRGRDLVGPGRAIAERFQLELDVKVRAMSRGMRQKLGIVLALAHRPRLLVLDEPTSGLDPLMQDELARAMRELADDGHTVFFSSHSLAEVEAVCDRIAIVRRGRIVADEALETLRRNASRRVTVFFESEAAAGAIAPPEHLVVRERRGARWECDLGEPASVLAPWLASPEIADFVIRPPDLETLFRSYYTEQKAGD